MIDDVTLGTDDLARSAKSYDARIAELGGTEASEAERIDVLSPG